MSHQRAALASSPGALMLLVLLLALACGDADAPVQPTLSPPPLDPRLTPVGEGSFALDISPNARQPIDPLELATAFGDPPVCASFVFLFTWRTSSSGQTLSFIGNRQGTEFDIVQGNQGQASVGGCMLIEAVNASGSAIKGEFRYIIAEAQR
jgi:hypothetical protein